MAFILDTLHLDSQTAQQRFSTYYSYLEKLRDKFPASAYNFATASWHYDFRDSKCPHDAWLEELRIAELSGGERQEVRRIEIFTRLIGAYHDGTIELSYPDVSSYFLQTPDSEIFTSHGDLLIDEVRLSERGNVVHEILFHRGTRFIIESKDIIYRWISI